MNTRGPIPGAWVLWACLAFVAPLAAGEVPFTPERWDLSRANVVEHLGRTSLTGTAVVKDLEFGDGIIEVDVAVTGDRSYPGILFRSRSETEYERLYIRPHRAGLYPDAVQYAPVFNGVATWQLYHGDGNTASARVPHDEWFTIRMEIKGSQARVFVGNGDAPDLVIDYLQHGESTGRVGLIGPTNGTAHFSNFRCRSTGDLEFAPAAEIEPPAGTLTTWQVSQAMPAEPGPQASYPRFYRIFLAKWQTVEAEPGGFVNLSKRSASSRTDPKTIWARTTVRSDVKQDVRLSIGYSDNVSVFLNRRPIYSGQSGYQSRDPSFVGVLGLFETLVLPLEPGLNEIFLIVTDSFGGWGFMARADRELDPPLKQEGRLTKAWETDDVFDVPESVLYDPERKQFYVSNFAKIDTRLSDTGFISRLLPDGEIKDLRWVTGLDGPCGMAIRQGRLYVVEAFKGKLVEIDIDSGRIVARHDVPEGHSFLNDVAADSAGKIYISDTSRGWGEADIYRFDNGAVEIWRGGYDLHRSNGLFVDGDRLVVGSVGEGLLKRIDLASGRMEVVAALGAGVIDGIRVDNEGNYLVSHWEGKLFRITPEGEVIELLDLREQGFNVADFEFVKEDALLVIPTFLGNRVVAYELTQSRDASSNQATAGVR